MATTAFRASAPSAVTHALLGPLAELPGTWMGSGFNLISLPDKHENKPFRLKLNATQETLAFNRIGAPIPNRGSGQDDIEFLGLHYLQLINDAQDHSALHLEPGIWLNVPPTTDPKADTTPRRFAAVAGHFTHCCWRTENRSGGFDAVHPRPGNRRSEKRYESTISGAVSDDASTSGHTCRFHRESEPRLDRSDQGPEDR